MATSTQQSGVSTGKIWCWRKPLCACWHRKILLLFFWEALFSSSVYCFGPRVASMKIVILDLKLASMIISPFFGWLQCSRCEAGEIQTHCFCFSCVIYLRHSRINFWRCLFNEYCSHYFNCCHSE